jgi:hypothetical protein
MIKRLIKKLQLFESIKDSVVHDEKYELILTNIYNLSKLMDFIYPQPVIFLNKPKVPLKNVNENNNTIQFVMELSDDESEIVEDKIKKEFETPKEPTYTPTGIPTDNISSHMEDSLKNILDDKVDKMGNIKPLAKDDIYIAYNYVKHQDLENAIQDLRSALISKTDFKGNKLTKPQRKKRNKALRELLYEFYHTLGVTPNIPQDDF